MAVELRVPPGGESITEVQIGEWLKKEGDPVRRDENIVIIETDKVTVELPSPADGVITKILVGNGEDASVGDVIGYLEEGAVAAASGEATKQAASGKASSAAQPGPAAAEKAALAQSLDEASAEDEAQGNVRDSLPPEAFARVMPAARRAAAEAEVDLGQVSPTGPGGRVLKED